MQIWIGRSSEQARLAPLVFAALAIILALWGQDLARGATPTDAVILFVTSGLLLAWSAGRSAIDEHALPPESPARNWARDSRSNMLLLTSMALNLLAVVMFQGASSSGSAWLPYLASVGLGLTGMLLTCQRKTHVAATYGPKAVSALLCLIVMVAAFFRLYNLDIQPAGLFYDEAIYGLDAGHVADGLSYPVYFDANFGRGALFIYLIVPFIKLAGASAFILRLVPAMIGVLTVPALYIFVKMLLGTRVALVSAALLAVSRWHVNFSRIAFDAILLPLLELLFFYFLIKGLRHRHRTDFVWAGVVGALGLNSYVAFRLVPLLAILLVLFLVMRRRGLDQQLASGLGTLLFSLFLVSSPFLLYYTQHSEVVNARLQTASVLSDRTLQGAAQALVENSRKHLLMFNVKGDHNGRHNLPGEPMLDQVSAALFAAGLCYCLLRIRRPPHAFLLAWFAVMLSAGILSVDFEAPQALRSIGIVPVALIFASLVLSRLLKAADRQPALLRSVAVAGTTGLIAITANLNFQNYFIRQASDFASWNDFSTGEALAAMEMKSLGSDWQYYVSSSSFDHPTTRFLAPQPKGSQRVEIVERLPISKTGEKNVALLLDPKDAALFVEAKRYYPNAVFKQLGPPFSGPASLLEVQLSQQDIASVQGLAARYYQSAEWNGPPFNRQDSTISFDWSAERPLRTPFSVEWEGVLSVSDYGSTVIGIESASAVEVWLDGSPLLKRGGEEQPVVLAKGNHALRVRAVVPEAAGRTELYWQPPGGVKTIVPRNALYSPPVTNNGLLGSYFANANWSNQPALQQIDPTLSYYFHNTPLPRPYSVEWIGKVQAPVAGIYSFGLESIDDSWFLVDGKPVVEVHEPNHLEERKLTLTEGWHDVRLRYLDKSGWSHVNLYWTPPGGRREIVPAERLLPPQESYPKTKPPTSITPPSLPIGASSSGSKASGVTPLFTVGSKGFQLGQLAQPKDLVIGPESVYVADTGNSRVQRFDAQGKAIAQIGERGNGPGQMMAPLAVAVSSDGDLLVLDEETGYVSRFAPNGTYRSRIAGPAAGFYHPRALATGKDGAVYVADTGSARIVAYASDGRLLRVLGGKGDRPGQLLGPVGIVLDVEGMLWVVDIDNHRVQRLSPEGEYLGGFDIPRGESVDGAHIALAADRLYLSDPAGARILVYSFDGRLLAEWGERGAGPGQLGRPVGIAVDAKGDVWVADRDNDRIQVFTLGY